jgi:hypothetical protein
LQQNLQAQKSKKKKKKNPQLLFSPKSSEEILILKLPLTQHPGSAAAAEEEEEYPNSCCSLAKEKLEALNPPRASHLWKHQRKHEPTRSKSCEEEEEERASDRAREGRIPERASRKKDLLQFMCVVVDFGSRSEKRESCTQEKK